MMSGLATTPSAMAEQPGDFAVLAGDDVFASPLLALGAAGGILASAHLRTGEFAELIAAWHAGDAGRARALGHRLAPLSAALFAEPNPAVIKGVLHAQGLIPSPAVRLPLLAGQPGLGPRGRRPVLAPGNGTGSDGRRPRRAAARGPAGAR